jgi:hypothetical protein
VRVVAVVEVAVVEAVLPVGVAVLLLPAEFRKIAKRVAM